MDARTPGRTSRSTRAFVSEPQSRAALSGVPRSESPSPHHLGRRSEGRTGGARQRRREHSMSMPCLVRRLTQSLPSPVDLLKTRRARRASCTWCRSRDERRWPPACTVWGARASASRRAAY